MNGKYFNNKQINKPMLKNRREADKLIDSAHKANALITLNVLHDKFGFGKKRLDKFQEEYLKVLDSFNNGYISAEDLNQVLWDETGRKVI